MKQLTTGLILAATLLAGVPAPAEGPVSFGPDLAARGWVQMDFRGRSPAVFEAEGPGRLEVRADAAVSVLYRVLPRQFATTEVADWRWRVDAGPPATDLTRRRGEDRALAVYFLFENRGSEATEPPKDLRSALRRGRALTYVWGGGLAPGSVLDSPQLRGRGRMIVLRQADAPPGTWLSESVSIRADFLRAFGDEPGPLVGVAVSSDSDDTGGETRAAVEGLTLR